MAFQFREKDAVGDCVKGFTKIRIDDVHWFSLVHPCSYTIIESHYVGEAGLALGEAMLAHISIGEKSLERRAFPLSGS